eukprot:GHVL01042811.1.p1 GENE.GHVL01042811.1~~GHVL01042811.1.p1  ORF type:complete len:1046 (-),score=335.21 GHVL01042811.1:1351-4488(-)
MFVIAGKNDRNPKIVIYNYPQMIPIITLRKGAAEAYTGVSFSPHNKLLAAISGAPDFFLYIFDYQNESLLLKQKAFSQDITTVYWCPFTIGSLITSGTGHIRFWSIKTTFTGVKLKEYLGKFGNSDLCDIYSVCELPNGNSLSSSSKEGILLLWEGGYVKYEYWQPPGDKPLHDKCINIIIIDNNTILEPSVITGGDDGYIKWWRLSDICNVEQPLGSQQPTITPIRKFHFKDMVVSSISVADDFWMIFDKIHGKLMKFSPKKDIFCELFQFHTKEITGVLLGENSLIVTAGSDGSIRAWNGTGASHLSIFSKNNNVSVTAVSSDWMPSETAIFTTGYSDGTIRIFETANNGFNLIGVSRLFENPVKFTDFLRGGEFIYAVNDEKDIFFVKNENNIISPWGYCQTEKKIINVTACNDFLAVSTDDGKILKIECPLKECPPLHEDLDFKLEINQKIFSFDSKDDDLIKGSIITNMIYLNKFNLAVSCKNNENIYLFIISLNNDTELITVTKELKLPQQEKNETSVSLLRLSKKKRFILVGFTDGRVIIYTSHFSDSMEIRNMDQSYGKITALSLVEECNLLVIGCSDGGGSVLTNSFINPLLTHENKTDNEILSSISEKHKSVNDILSNTMSITQTKVAAKNLIRQQVAEKKKERIMSEIFELRNEMSNLISESKSIGLTEEILGNPKYIQKLIIMEEEKINNLKIKLLPELMYYRLGVKKLQNKFSKNIIQEEISLKGYLSNEAVSTYRITDLSSNLKKRLQEIKPLSAVTVSEDTDNKKSIFNLKNSNKDEISNNVDESMNDHRNNAELLNERLYRVKYREERSKRLTELLKSKPVNHIINKKNEKEYDVEIFNVEKHISNLCFLEEAILNMKKEFDYSVVSLINAKASFEESLLSDIKRIFDMSKELNETVEEPFHSLYKILSNNNPIENEVEMAVTLSSRKDIQRRCRDSQLKNDNLKKDRIIRLRRDKGVIERRTKQMISCFDETVEALAVERAKLDVDLKCANIKFLTLLEELDLLMELKMADDQLEENAEKLKKKKKIN